MPPAGPDSVRVGWPPPPPREHSRRRPRPPRRLPSPPCSVRPGRQRRAGRRGRRPGNRPPNSPGGPRRRTTDPLSTSRAEAQLDRHPPGVGPEPGPPRFGGDGLGDPGFGFRRLTPVDGDGQTLALDLDTGRGGRDQPRATDPLDRRPLPPLRLRLPDGGATSIRPLEAVESDEPETGGDPAQPGAVIGWSMTGRGRCGRSGRKRADPRLPRPPPNRRASRANSSATPPRGRASSGSATIGDSVPSKSDTMAEPEGSNRRGAKARRISGDGR